jgi:hypothetical protein
MHFRLRSPRVIQVPIENYDCSTPRYFSAYTCGCMPFRKSSIAVGLLYPFLYHRKQVRLNFYYN